MEFSGKRILWAESNPDEYDPLYDLVCDLVGKNHLRQVKTESAALKALQTVRFDVFMTEFMLPWDRKMINEKKVRLEAGIRLITQLRDSTSWRTKNDCPVLVFSSLGPEWRWDRARELVGKSGFLLRKPKRIETVIEEIRKLLTV